MDVFQLQRHLNATFGDRNRRVTPQLVDRIMFLNLAVGYLQEAVQKHRGEKAKIRYALARVIGWTCCVAEYMPNSNIVLAMSAKYPEMGCGYCGKPVCSCKGHRKRNVPGEPNPVQCRWSITRWQAHFQQVYGEKNRQRGLENCINRLFKEVTEIIELHIAQSLGADLPDFPKLFVNEVVDIIAWCFGIAYLLKINLEDGLVELYGRGCTGCRSPVCICPTVIFDIFGHMRVGSVAAA